MRILLVRPPVGERTLGLKHMARVEPLGLEVVGAAVRDFDVRLLDMEVEGESLERTLRDYRPRVVGVGAYVVHTYTAHRVLRLTKRFDPDILTVVGGHHPTLCPEEFDAPWVDCVVLGEGSAAFRELVCAARDGRDLSGVSGLALRTEDGLRFTGPRRLPDTLDDQPLPDRSLSERYRSRYFYLHWSSVGLVQTSAGCPHGCNFCSCQKFTRRRFLARPPEAVVRDLERLDEDCVMFCDDHSFTDARRMERMAELIDERGLRKRFFAYSRTDSVVRHPEVFEKWADVGLELLMTGLEAIDDLALDRVEKGTSAELNERALEILDRLGVGVSAGFLVAPDFTEEDFRRIDRYVAERPVIRLLELTPLTPLPGTDLHREIGDRVLTEHRELYDLFHFVIPTETPRRELYGWMREYYVRGALRSIARLGPSALLGRHAPRVAAGAVKNLLGLGRAHEIPPAPALDGG